MSGQPSVRVDYVEGYHALKLTWDRDIKTQDIRPAFMAISSELDRTEEPLYVVVDITSDPVFPVVDTVLEALSSVIRHENLAEWLVVGRSPSAKLIEELLVSITGISNVRWFDSEADTLAYLDSLNTK